VRAVPPHLLASPPIQAPHAATALSYKTTCRASLGRCDACFINSESKLDLLTHDTPLHERQDVSQEPTQISTPDSPLERATCSVRRGLPHTYPTSPTAHIEVNNFTICIRQHHTRLRKVATAAAANSHRAFTVETSSGPTQRPHRWLPEGTSRLVREALLQAPLAEFRVACSCVCLTAKPASTSAVAGSDVEILQRSPMTLHAVCLVARRQPHIQRVT
jgi:hypothetical protein